MQTLLGRIVENFRVTGFIHLLLAFISKTFFKTLFNNMDLQKEADLQ